MAPSLLLTKMAMTPLRVMGMVVGVAVICLVFSALRAPSKASKLGSIMDQPPAAAAAAAAALHVKRDNSGRTMADSRFWHTFDFQSESIPAAVVDAASKVTVTTDNVNIMGAATFYREAKPPAGVEASGEVVVLLHGAAFKSATWLDLNTINLLAGMGHRVIAVDLPGFGESKRAAVQDKAEYLRSLLARLEANKPILVSPSMSGGFSIPFLTQHPEVLAGYVPVAPVGSAKNKAMYKELKQIASTGFGNSGRQELGPQLRRTWLQSFLIALNLPPCVVVSPSFSGVYSLPMLMLQPHEFDGFVPIAVDAADEIPVHNLQAIREGTGEADDSVLPGGVDASRRQQGGQVTGGDIQGEELRA
ncbi:Protein ABHD14B [Chionoecetes opilio]|uniref:Protein ABHD14B n=1 Tax=Chionoecetes opilio TaxID=41210 RepID=A0A8J4YAW9_CHIOP|nr:Protein ABHD14B [Chionoecetes opilio]